MTDTITSARVRELSAKATDGPWSVAPKLPLVHRWRQPGNDTTGTVLVAECGDYQDKEIARFNMERWHADAALIAALCSEPARNRIAAALELLERVEADDGARKGGAE